MSAQPPSLLIVEDDLALQKQLKWSMDRFESVTADDVASAVLQFRRHKPPVVTMDLGLPPDQDSTSEGFRLLEKLIELEPGTKVIVLTGQNDQSNALRAIRMGAYDFLAKPVDPDVLVLTVERAMRLHELQQENQRLLTQQDGEPTGRLLTRDPQMQRICRTVERVAGSDATVLLLGESGTGKEVLAQSLHDASKRKGRFVAINCAAIPEALLESELFGYERGAFTGATKTTVGKIETAHGGTLMLDEIGDLPMPLQAKLLRFLQERSIERLGGRQEIAVDVRIVGATHQDLKAKIAQGLFREDLFYRLAEIVVDIPPLRDRVGDAVLLSHAFLRRFSSEQRRPILRLADDAIRAVEGHRWPGNVRELQNVMKRASIMADGDRITADDLNLPLPAGGEAAAEEPELDLRAVRERAERQAVVAALARTDGNIAKAADLLGVSRPTLYDLMSRLGVKA
ncbi:PEP-CTERM-box response regulator transcription factor [Mitsuaria sp. TWR114]|jgi:two-component system NtrC family response regulator|uniref:PEP-CTERM-box response regulator transcription factor n=1 Tax=unclassified Roseateles TaxID=2626991 RepID=UPI0008DF0B16|nr:MULTISPECIES: PEP-CTERM-box response regulator transcription factor [unclassified Roseateles]TXD80897.1 PEP-CTERM-box response regulator transcription factor [Mitsuaria sp. TWR114]SFR77372.1 two-component system, NtrC family, response regulator [Mitsuaria sp. PDC51]